MSKSKYYVVWKGLQPGIFTSWKDCETSVKGFEGARFKAFNDKAIAELAYAVGPGVNIWSAISQAQYSELKEKINMPVLDSISVDAACSGNPGIMEYHGVDTRTGKVLFSQGPFDEATVNLGEFLAIVHALAEMKRQKKKLTVYSDSQTAIKWIKDKHVNTRLEKSSKNKQLFDFVGRAVMWLKSNEYGNPVLKWETETWGEIPADYGRK